MGSRGCGPRGKTLHRYESPRAYTVSLTFTSAGGSSTETREDYVLVTFPDVPADFWSYRHIEYIAAAQVAGGYTDGLYHPENPVTRDQMAVYISRALNLT
jgi:PKD repeat protein